MSDDDAGRLNPDSLEEYFRVAAVSVFELGRGFDARLEIDPVSEQLRLFVPAEGEQPDVSAFERITVDRVGGPEGNPRFRLVFDARRMHYPAYQLIEAILALMRNAFSFGHAVMASIADMKDLLANRARLSPEEVVGLWGELLVLEHVIKRSGEAAAIDTWLGPSAAEHDFSFDEFEVEVKTTRSESRRHLISSESQLEVSPNRPLFLLSLQLTLAGGADAGRTLPQIVNEIGANLTKSDSQFYATLDRLGYYRSDADLYQTSFQLRTQARAYLVDDDFPAITRPRLAAVVEGSQHLSDVRYRVDVGGLNTPPCPRPLTIFVRTHFEHGTAFARHSKCRCCDEGDETSIAAPSYRLPARRRNGGGAR